jgi:hypothetical protein
MHLKLNYKNSDSLTKYVDEQYMIIQTLKTRKENHRVSKGDEAQDAPERQAIVMHLFADNNIDWFLSRVSLHHSHDLK